MCSFSCDDPPFPPPLCLGRRNLPLWRLSSPRNCPTRRNRPPLRGRGRRLPLCLSVLSPSPSIRNPRRLRRLDLIARDFPTPPDLALSSSRSVPRKRGHYALFPSKAKRRGRRRRPTAQLDSQKHRFPPSFHSHSPSHSPPPISDFTFLPSLSGYSTAQAHARSCGDSSGSVGLAFLPPYLFASSAHTQ